MPYNEYQVRLELFEGPLDLLLYLVSKDELEITAISISTITRQYLEYLDLMKELNIDIAAEYLHMAATLLRLKARELLPQGDQRPDELMDEYGIYTREQLIQQLLEYKKYKEAAQALKKFEAQQCSSFARCASELQFDDDTNCRAATEVASVGTVTIFDLLTAFKGILERSREKETPHVVIIDEPKIDERIEIILSMLSEKEEIRFEELFAADRRKISLIVTFLAILELVKMQQIWLRQVERFGAIFVRYRKEHERESPAQLNDLYAMEFGETENSARGKQP